MQDSSLNYILEGNLFRLWKENYSKNQIEFLIKSYTPNSYTWLCIIFNFIWYFHTMSTVEWQWFKRANIAPCTADPFRMPLFDIFSYTLVMFCLSPVKLAGIRSLLSHSKVFISWTKTPVISHIPTILLSFLPIYHLSKHLNHILCNALFFHYLSRSVHLTCGLHTLPIQRNTAS